MKKVLLLIGFMVGLTGIAFAEIPSDSFQITFTPSGARGVIISSDTPVALGGLAAGSSTTTGAIPTISTGTINKIEYSISGTVSGGADSLTPNGYAVPESTEVMVQAQFDADGTISWAADDNVDGTLRAIGTVTQGGSFVGDYATGDLMDSMDLNETRYLYCQVVLPATVDYTGEQTVTITLTARVGD